MAPASLDRSTNTCASCAFSTAGAHIGWYAFDPRRIALLLIGGDKTGDDSWYDVFVPVADRLYDEHLEQLRKEGWRKNG
jgi:hypothetical protein